MQYSPLSFPNMLPFYTCTLPWIRTKPSKLTTLFIHMYNNNDKMNIIVVLCYNVSRYSKYRGMDESPWDNLVAHLSAIFSSSFSWLRYANMPFMAFWLIGRLYLSGVWLVVALRLDTGLTCAHKR